MQPLFSALRATLLLAAAGLVGSPPLPAVQLAQDATGDVVLYPLATNADDFDSLFVVANTSEQAGSAVRLTMRDGSNGARVASLNVLLAPGDTFAATLNDTRLQWNDASCVSIGLGEGSSDVGSGSIEIGAGFAGYLEAIQMASIDPASDAGAILEGSGADCQAVRNELIELRQSERLPAPNGSLSGSSYVIDVDEGLNLSLEPTVLEQFRDQHLYEPADDEQPSLADAAPAESEVIANGEPGSGSEIVHSTWSSGIDAVSAVLMARSLETDFTVEPGLGARSDMVLTFPTRHHYVGLDGLSEGPPFVIAYLESELEAVGQQFSLVARNRAGKPLGTTNPDNRCSPQPALEHPGPVLQTSQLSIRIGTQSVVDAAQAYQAVQVRPDTNVGCTVLIGEPVYQFMDAGKIQADFELFELVSNEGHVYQGLPVIGWSITSVVNQSLGGGDVRANYGAVNTIRREMSVESDSL